MVRLSNILVRLGAVLVLVAYGAIARYAGRGAADPIWTEVQARGVLRIGSDPGFQPFADEQAGRWQGYDIDLASEIATRLGLRPEFVAVGYDALYDKLAAGDVDLLAAALPLAPAQGWRARFTGAYLDAGQVLVAPTTAGIANESELEGRRVGAALGSDGDTILRRLQRTQPGILADSSFDLPPDALAALERGALDAVITDAVSALSLTQRNSRFQIVRGLTFEPYVLAVPVHAYQLQSEINRVLDDLRREQYFDRLNAKWFGNGSKVMSAK